LIDKPIVENMPDKFGFLTLKQAIAVQIFYSSPDDENLVGKTLYSEDWVESTGVIEAISFRKTGGGENEMLAKLIKSKDYKNILNKYDSPGATFEMVVIYKDEQDVLKEMNLTDAIKLDLSPEELPKQIMDFLLEKEEFSFLK
jgi:hypothetical protein